jgi:hypothetical protein
MNSKNTKPSWGIVIIFGAVWGLSEALLGMWLRSCASSVSGSLMTGVALFFIGSSWILTRNILGVSLLVAVAAFFKMSDAFLLSIPLRHGAVANPIFAFIMEGAAFLMMAAVIKESTMKKHAGRAFMGGISALLAVNLFPLVKIVTGIPACVVPGTGFPLSLYYAPVAVLFSLFTVPLGMWLGDRIQNMEAQREWIFLEKKLSYLAAPLALICCLTVLALIRLI